MPSEAEGGFYFCMGWMKSLINLADGESKESLIRSMKAMYAKMQEIELKEKERLVTHQS